MKFIKSKLLRNAVYLTATQVFGRSIRFIYVFIIARLLGPEETGIYLYGLALYLSLIGIAQFGQHTILLQRVGKHRGMPKVVLNHSLSLTLMATFGVAVAMGGYVWLSEPEPLLRLAILFFVAAMISRVLAEWVRVAYVAFERPDWVPRYEVVFRGSEALVGTVALMSGGGLLAICILHFLFWSLEAGAALRKIGREYPGALALGRHWRYIKKVASVSVVFLISFTAFAVFLQISIILLRKLQPDSALVGHFGIAMQFFGALMMAPLAATQAFLPRLSRSFARNGNAHDLITAVKLIGLTGLAVAVIAAAYGPWFITLVLGERYTEAAELFRWLCLVFVPCSIVAFLCQCFSVINRRWLAAGIMTGMSISHAVLMVMFIDQSPTSAAIGSMLIAAAVAMIIALHQTGPILRLDNSGWWTSLFVVGVVTYAIFESGLAPLMVLAPIALTVGGLLTLVLKVLQPKDISALRRLQGKAS